MLLIDLFFSYYPVFVPSLLCQTDRFDIEEHEDLREYRKPGQWKKHQPAVLLDGNRTNFQACPELAERLLRTGDRPLAEASPSDSICGIGLGPLDPRAQDPAQWRGLNLLGRVLETVRSELRRAGADCSR